MKRTLATALAAVSLAGCGLALDTGDNNPAPLSDNGARLAWNALTPQEQDDICWLFWNTSDANLADYLRSEGATGQQAQVMIDLWWEEC